MAHLWTQDQSAGEWVAMPLTDSALVVAAPGAHALHLRPRGEFPNPPAALLRSQLDGRESWVLTGAARVNGMPLLTGIRVLRDRDELEIGGLCAFFSTETLALVQPMPRGDKPVFCPRCKQAIEPKSAAVRCPQCRVWHHQSDDLPCWTYANAEHCSLCDQPTALDAGYRWTPEEL
jgi:hypothetical protein